MCTLGKQMKRMQLSFFYTHTHTRESLTVSKEVIGMSQYERIHIWKEAIPRIIVPGIAYTEK